MGVRFRRPKMTDKAVDIHTFVMMQDWLERVANMTTDASLSLSTEYPNFMLRSAAAESTMTYSDFAFGYSISGAVVTVNSGKVRHGTRTPITVAGADKTISEDQSYIFVTYTYGSGVATLGTPTPVEPVDTEGVHNHILYLVTLTSGVASIASGNIKHIGDIWLPGNVG